MEWSSLLRPELLAAFFSAIATLFAAYATWVGPRSAAKLAEKIRQENDKSIEKRRTKLSVFGALMENRAAYHSFDSVRAFNLIDIAFNDSPAVRDAWAEFFLALDESRKVPEHEKSNLFRKLLSEMSIDLGLSDRLRIDDFGRVYFPKALADEEFINAMRRKEALDLLQGQKSPSANTAIQFIDNGLYPPPPPKA
jgi:hypothetical protein